MPYKDKQKELEFRREYSPQWRKDNPDKCRQYEKTYLADPKNLANKKAVRKLRESQPEVLSKNARYKRTFNERRLALWAKFIPEVTNCEVCRKLISFQNRPDMGIIHFDHRQGGEEVIKISPRKWLKNHPPSEVNLKIWESCDFGLLCLGCNSILPTVGRIEFLKNALIYAEGLR